MEKPAENTNKFVSVSPYCFKLSDDWTTGEFTGVKCKNCGTILFGSPKYCLNCSGEAMELIALSSQGKVVTYTIIHTAPSGWQGKLPYILGTVRLPEGPQIPSEIIDCDFDEIRIGLAVEMVARIGGQDKQGNNVIVYKWRPIAP